jgi:hypothetical protein
MTFQYLAECARPLVVARWRCANAIAQAADGLQVMIELR